MEIRRLVSWEGGGSVFLLSIESQLKTFSANKTSRSVSVYIYSAPGFSRALLTVPQHFDRNALAK